MIALIFYIALLIALGTLIVFLLRQKGSYFRSVQILFAIGFLSIAGLALSDLIKNFLIRLEWMALFTSISGTSAALIAAIVVEHAALTLFKRSREKVPSTTFFREKLNVLSAIYKGYTTTILIIAWVFTPWQTQLVRNFWGELVYIPIFEGWYLICLATVLAAFIAYPCSLFYLASRKYREKRVVDAMRWLGLCWAGVGVVLMTYHGYLRSLEIEAVSIGYLFQLFFFIIITYFFKKTTILESFFEALHPSVPFREGEAVILTYSSVADKMKVFSAFIREGLESGDAVWYTYPNEESETVRAKLKEHGVNVEKHEKDGSLRLENQLEVVRLNDKLDFEKLVTDSLNDWAELKRRGYKHLRDIEDVGDFSFVNGQWQKWITEYWLDPRWNDSNVSEWVAVDKPVGVVYDPFLMEITAINVEHMTETEVTEILTAFGEGAKASARFVDLLKDATLFSKLIGLDHEGLIGRKILLEIDPVSNYEKVIHSLAKESMANVEPIYVFTSSASPLHTYLAKQPSINFFLTSISTSTPKTSSENTVLLPAKNTPLILAAIDKILKTNADTNVCFVFNILSELLTTIGRDRTFTFLRHALDMLSSEKTTSLFLLNPGAHKTEEVSRLRNLFRNQLTYGKNGLEIVKTS